MEQVADERAHQGYARDRPCRCPGVTGLPLRVLTCPASSKSGILPSPAGSATYPLRVPTPPSRPSPTRVKPVLASDGVYYSADGHYMWHEDTGQWLPLPPRPVTHTGTGSTSAPARATAPVSPGTFGQKTWRQGQPMGIPLVLWLVGGILLATCGGYTANSAINDPNDSSYEECYSKLDEALQSDDANTEVPEWTEDCG